MSRARAERMLVFASPWSLFPHPFSCGEVHLACQCACWQAATRMLQGVRMGRLAWIKERSLSTRWMRQMRVCSAFLLMLQAGGGDPRRCRPAAAWQAAPAQGAGQGGNCCASLRGPADPLLLLIVWIVSQPHTAHPKRALGTCRARGTHLRIRMRLCESSCSVSAGLHLLLLPPRPLSRTTSRTARHRWCAGVLQGQVAKSCTAAGACVSQEVAPECNMAFNGSPARA